MATQSIKTDSLIQLYLSEHFNIQVNGQKRDLEYLGSETENLDRVVAYLTIEKVTDIQTLTFFNEVFQELFEDQINMLHLDINGKKKSTFFSNKNREEEMKFK